MIATKNLAFIKSNIALLSFPALFTMAPEDSYLNGFRWIGKKGRKGNLYNGT